MYWFPSERFLVLLDVRALKRLGGEECRINVVTPWVSFNNNSHACTRVYFDISIIELIAFVPRNDLLSRKLFQACDAIQANFTQFKFLFPLFSYQSMFLALYLPSALAHFKRGIDKFLILSETFSEEKPPKYFYMHYTREVW